MSDEIQTEKTIELRKPVKWSGAEITEIRMQAPTIGQRKKAEQRFRNGVDVQAGTNYGVALVALCAGVNEGLIEMMDVDQFEEAYAFVQGFSERGQATGKLSA